ncbi:MAG: Smr/MutS family protein [Clostridia bacterium]
MQIKIINLEDGMPLVYEAMERLECSLQVMRAKKIKHALIIHGYGKRTHGGGKIKEATRTALKQKLSSGEIRKVVFGENLSIFDSFGGMLSVTYDNVREYLTGRNIGITVIEL